ncbi:cytochrome C [Maribacter algarum]|uniref:Cytochrome C n=1 Tax=Maribacter algarum (ex Zhang et al. 2020) TaxID=2578118 RepID=A0A5S3PHD5_9FLAO|nr:heme-binding domain-containing protein [Maribacter algarum]TMM53668.1 cytochrome C [Maribacter algarum]
MKIVKKVAVALLIAFIAMQFYRPEKNQAQGDHTAQFLTETNPAAEIKIILQQTCYNCHSNHTEYPWYNNVAPVSYWLSNHIKDGKKHLNFSDWETYDIKKKDHKLEEIAEEVKEEEMPLKEYTWTHEEAKLTAEQRNAIVAWVQQTRALYQLNQQPK